ncbi:hypothetical protein JGS22_014970 [Streptomyces sp. P38-E01]|uniref:Uncharacterized protein n=1 Tax=Streptomyces tardus TaxID=2780544 RepID=A0A949N8S7_9ACTN|nr:hypothetical protein [Streptomyces tardus]MBU7598881.1 hypothetical protein [Streptomyces tardus]
MTRSSSDTTALVDEINHRLADLTSLLSQLPPQQVVRLLPSVLNSSTGALAGFTRLTAAGALISTTEAEQGAVPVKVCLALHRAATGLSSVGQDLAPHLAAVAHLPAPHGAEGLRRPAPAPLVVRRGR